MNDQEKERLGGDRGENGVAALIFEDGGDKRAASRRLTNRLSGRRDGGSQRGQMFAVEVAVGSRVNQESVAPNVMAFSRCAS